MTDLGNYVLPIAPAPARIREAAAQGIRREEFLPGDQARLVLDVPIPPADGVWRADDGRVLVTCTTDLPGVTPQMVDWWFGWHLPSSERYRLWHPKAHVASRVKDDRSSIPDDRRRYLQNVSYIDEYIGARLEKLAIVFVAPGEFGFEDLDARGATAICASTSDRTAGGEGGSLIHLVVSTGNGSQMRSGFWLGTIRHNIALIDRLLGGLLNTKLMRNILVSDRMALDLLLHCGEEMNHLARFLPQLYADVHEQGKA